LGDALAVCLLKSRGFTADDFAATHPHGTLGRRLLLTIADIMVSGELMPIVLPGTTIRKALVEMSRGALGFVVIADSDFVIQGVFTDGDLRRTLDNEVDIKTTLIEKVMNAHFISAKSKQLAVEAVELMEEYKMSALPIIDDANHLVGVLNIRILLQSGVI
jgi:arabinose-5-phosphate isomerase